MITCLWNGKTICALDVYNKYGIKNVLLEKEWRKASQNNELRCEECGEIVVLRAGIKNSPHFSHKSTVEGCYYETHKETEERRKGRRLYYNFLRRCHSSQEIKVNYKHANRIRSDFYIEDQKLAIELQRLSLKVDDWDEKNKIYDELEIIPIWVLFGDSDHLDQLDFFKNLMFLDTKDQILRVIDIDKKILILMKEINYQDPEIGEIRYQEIYKKEYDLEVNDDSDLDEDIIEDFVREFEKAKIEWMGIWKQKGDYKRRIPSWPTKKVNVNEVSIERNLIDDIATYDTKIAKSSAVKAVRNDEIKLICIHCHEEKTKDESWYYNVLKGICQCHICKSTAPVNNINDLIANLWYYSGNKI